MAGCRVQSANVFLDDVAHRRILLGLGVLTHEAECEPFPISRLARQSRSGHCAAVVEKVTIA